MRWVSRRLPAINPRRQQAELDYVTSSGIVMMGLADNYVGLPLGDHNLEALAR
jgi:hypothetical protein